MTLHPLAGKPAPAGALPDIGKLIEEYFSRRPDPSNPLERVRFGTSGHRGTSLNGTFTEQHVLAITQAICDYRAGHGITGPLFVGKDTHALSGPAERTALEVLAANGVEAVLQADDGYTPTPVISHAILQWNAQAQAGTADGIVITPSHNPPTDGGLKYNPPNGGPADATVTRWIEQRANQYLANGLRDVRRMPYDRALAVPTTHMRDLVRPYVEDLSNVIDMEAIRSAGLRLGVDPLGGSSLAYWTPIAHRYRLNLEVVNTEADPTFRFMRLDHDGVIRMDCSSPYAMAGLVDLKDRFDVAFGTDPDADRHGIVTPSAGLMNPNHYLATAIRYLLLHRPQWPPQAAVGKTLVSSGIIDRLTAALGRKLYEVPVGFKWFAGGLYESALCFGGEESAGASFLRRDGKVWVTDKDGILLCLLAAEITACTGKEPGEHYREITDQFGNCYYRRIDSPAAPEQKQMLERLSPEDVRAGTLAGHPVIAKLTHAPGNGAPLGGLKVTTAHGWFAARPSGTEDICKIYAESFLSEEHLEQILSEAREIVAAATSR